MVDETLPPQPRPAPPAPGRSRTLILVGGAVVLFILSYVLAWGNAYRLSAGYLKDADASYAEGRYLDALLGYQKFNPARQRYVQHGGYIQVQRIWENRYAWPKPDLVERAQERINEILEQRLSIAEAEQFIQENIGRSNPYMGIIYLRLGELYEADGRLRDAEDVYTSVPDLFPDDQALIERARRNLERLQQQDSGSILSL
jgi:tetratricopeptide (TPR) repeat protein